MLNNVFKDDVGAWLLAVQLHFDVYLNCLEFIRYNLSEIKS